MSVRWRRERRGRQLSCEVQISLVVSVEVAGFGSEKQRRRRQVAVRRREIVFGGGEADFEVVFDSSGAQESAVAAV